jgi:hypothetical protein
LIICKQSYERSGSDPTQPIPQTQLCGSILYGLAGAKVSVHPLERLIFSENTDHAAPAPIDSEAAMQYAHMGLQDRRDQNLDGNGSVWPLIHAFEPFCILTCHSSVDQFSPERFEPGFEWESS